MPETCQGQPVGFTGRCERKPNVVRDGKPYCWQHDPERLDRIRAEKWAKRKAEIARIEAEADRRIARQKLIDQAGIDNLTNDDLRLIVSLGGIHSMIARFKLA